MDDVYIEKKRFIPIIVMMGCFLILFYFAGYYSGAENQVKLCNQFIYEEYHNDEKYTTTTDGYTFDPSDFGTNS